MKHRWLILTIVLGGWTWAASGWAEEAAPDHISLDETTRARCLRVLREGFASGEFWPSMHAAEGLSLAGLGAEVRSALTPRLESEVDAQHRCGLAREIARAGDLSRVRVLLDTLAVPEAYGHVHACESLFKISQIGDGVRLRHVLAQAGKPQLKIMAAAALARWGSPSAMETLRAYVKSDEGEIARIAAWVLARTGDRSDVASLRAGRSRFSDPLTRAYFAHALAALGDVEGRAALVKNLGDEDFNVRVYAAEFAPDAQAVGAKDALLRLLDDPVLDVRIRAADALIRLARPSRLARGEPIVREVFPATAANPRYSEGSILALRDGRLLYTTTEFADTTSDFAKARIIAVESTDEGNTWSTPRVVQENVGKNNVMSVTLRRLDPKAIFDGPIGLFYLVKNSTTDLHVYLRVSDDEGTTFGSPIRVTSEPGYHVLNNDRVTVLSSGRLIVPVASTRDVDREYSFICACYLSDDQGKTWHRGQGSAKYPKRGAMEPEVVELSDGKLLMHIRTQLGHIAVSESSDGGDTWTEPRSWNVRGPESPATLRRIPSTGDLLLIWNDTFREGEDHGGRRTPLTAAVSTDDGKTWSFRRDLETSSEDTYAYTSVLFYRARALLSYYVEGGKPSRISSRFRSVPITWFYEKTR